MIRQGDIYFKPISEEELSKHIHLHREPTDDRNRHIVAEGEATGHHHAIETTLENPNVHILHDPDTGEKFVVTLDAPAALVHEEHKTVTLDPGVYQVVNQREYVAPNRQRRVYD